MASVRLIEEGERIYLLSSGRFLGESALEVLGVKTRSRIVKGSVSGGCKGGLSLIKSIK